MVVLSKHKGCFTHKESKGGSIEIGSERKTTKASVGENPVLAVNLPSSLFSTYKSQDNSAPYRNMVAPNALAGGTQARITVGGSIRDKFRNLTFREGRKGKSDNVKLRL